MGVTLKGLSNISGLFTVADKFWVAEYTDKRVPLPRLTCATWKVDFRLSITQEVDAGNLKENFASETYSRASSSMTSSSSSSIGSSGSSKLACLLA